MFSSVHYRCNVLSVAKEVSELQWSRDAQQILPDVEVWVVGVYALRYCAAQERDYVGMTVGGQVAVGASGLLHDLVRPHVCVLDVLLELLPAVSDVGMNLPAYPGDTRMDLASIITGPSQP